VEEPFTGFLLFSQGYLNGTNVDWGVAFFRSNLLGADLDFFNFHVLHKPASDDLDDIDCPAYRATPGFNVYFRCSSLKQRYAR
jgi:hypothetical protein